MKNSWLGLLGFAAIVIAMLGAGYIESHYAMNATVISVNDTEVVAEDILGERWSFDGDDYHEGQDIRLVFFTNNTDENRKDDEIVGVR